MFAIFNPSTVSEEIHMNCALANIQLTVRILTLMQYFITVHTHILLPLEIHLYKK